jgi:hypothetical protein
MNLITFCDIKLFIELVKKGFVRRRSKVTVNARDRREKARNGKKTTIKERDRRSYIEKV